ncbi:MAG TPA: hypothetical protein IAB66_01475 [Candidatus Caccousia avistercoris]|nr:hypothetical protein [Candidatus Caccousia avistercoris]
MLKIPLYNPQNREIGAFWNLALLGIEIWQNTAYNIHNPQIEPATSKPAPPQGGAGIMEADL